MTDRWSRYRAKRKLIHDMIESRVNVSSLNGTLYSIISRYEDCILSPKPSHINVTVRFSGYWNFSLTHFDAVPSIVVVVSD